VKKIQVADKLAENILKMSWRNWLQWWITLSGLLIKIHMIIRT